MVEDEEEGFSFGEFKFVPSSQPHINGVTSTSKNDDLWGDFFVSPLSPQSSSSQFQFKPSNNGFSPSPPKPYKWAQPTAEQSPTTADPGSNKFRQSRGALPLSLFGEVEEEEGSNVNSNGWFDPNASIHNGNFGVDKNDVVNKSETPDLIVNNVNNNTKNDEDEDDEWEFKGAFSGNDIVEEPNLKGGSVVSGFKVEPLPMMNEEKQAGQDASYLVDHKPGSISFTPQFSDLFAASSNGANHQSSEMEIGFMSSSDTSNGFIWDPFLGAEDIGNRSGISASSINEDGGANPQSSEMDVGFKSTTSTTNGFMWDPFPGAKDIRNGSGIIASSINEDANGANHQSSEVDVGFKSTTTSTNGFTWDPFVGVEHIENGSGISASSITADDDFGDFLDASQEVVSNEQEQVVANKNPAEAQPSNGAVQEKENRTEHSRGALPLSLFSDYTEESSNYLNLQNEVVNMPSLSPGKSFGGQGSMKSIHDLISNLYSEVQCTSVDFVGKPAENGVTFPPKSTVAASLGEDDEWDDGAWEFKGVSSEYGVGEQLSAAITGNMPQKQFENIPEMRHYIDFYDELRDSLCFLLSCQLEELKKSQTSDAVAGNGEKVEALDDEIQETFKLLESVTSKEGTSIKGHERNSCLDKFLEVLQGPKFHVIESEFSLSKRLQLAANEWRIAAELLRHVIPMSKIISLGSAEDQSLYASTWSKIINVCVQELRYGVSIWKRASEKNVQHQILSDSRGQQYIQALAEIYKVVELLELSARVYKPWILLNMSDSLQVFGVLDECDALWSKSGLEEAVRSLSDDVDYGCSETANALLVAIKNLRDIDIISIHDLVFLEHKSICRLSLLPRELPADLKTVTWGDNVYFVNLANLWGNLISSDPPQLPLLQVS